MALHVEVVTPEREVFSGEATEVVAPGYEGEFSVLPEHDLLVALLEIGVLTIRTAERAHKWVTGPGFAEIGDNRVTLLVDSIEAEADIDKAAAQQQLTEAEAELGAGAAGTEEWDRAVEKRAFAAARLSI